MEKNFKKVGIIYNSDVCESLNLAKKLEEKFENPLLFSVENMSSDVDLAIAIGGDGTFLKTARFYAPYSIPILGFNVGRLGYLAQAKPDEINEVVEKETGCKCSSSAVVMMLSIIVSCMYIIIRKKH